jgi:hypothetical protein
MRVNKEEIESIKRLAAGGKTPSEIAEELNITRTKALYWSDDDYREKAKASSTKRQLKLHNIGKSWAKKHPEEYRIWFRQYQKNRYDTDPLFRMKMLKANRERMARIRKERLKEQ